MRGGGGGGVTFQSLESARKCRTESKDSNAAVGEELGERNGAPFASSLIALFAPREIAIETISHHEQSDESDE
jgi:hypothetical protein